MEKKKHTDETAAKHAVRLKLLAMGDHRLSHHIHGKHLLPVLSYTLLGDRLDVDIHAAVELLRT
jgi:hypothetical protein